MQVFTGNTMDPITTILTYRSDLAGDREGAILGATGPARVDSSLLKRQHSNTLETLGTSTF